MNKIFVDGQEGTTGLKIHEYLLKRNDLDILKIKPEERKNPEVRKNLINQADIVFLCLPDSAAKESVSLVENTNTRIIDASTAHRTNEDWTYGLPELNNMQRNIIKKAKRVSVPGCHATGFALSVHPLVNLGILSADYPVTFHSLTGYSGGGKNLINKYNNLELSNINSPKPYALSLSHKHLPEMKKMGGLKNNPIFMPVVSNYFHGMVTTLPLATRLLKKKVSASEIQQILSEYYANEPFIKVMPFGDESYLENGFLNVESCVNTNRCEILVFGDEEQVMVCTRFDNLGKGASGAAIQNMNIMLGVKEDTGLIC